MVSTGSTEPQSAEEEKTHNSNEEIFPSFGLSMPKEGANVIKIMKSQDNDSENEDSYTHSLSQFTKEVSPPI